MWLRWLLGFSLALTSVGLLDVAQQKNDIVFDDDDNESGGAVASHDDATPVQEADSTLSDSPGDRYDDEVMPEKPAAPVFSSEMQAGVQVRPGSVQVVEQWPLHTGMHVMSLPGGPEMPQKKVSSLAATSHYISEVRPNLGPLKTQQEIMTEVSEEYDDAAVEGDTTGLPSANEQVSLADGEPLTYEDKHRKRHGDVDKIVPRKKIKHADPPEYHPPPPAPQQPQAPMIKIIPGGPYIPGSFVGRRKNLRENFEVGTKRNAEARMMDQCKSYTNYLVKAQGPVMPPMGPKILQMMKSTCDGAIRAGAASSQYTLMCNALGSAVEPFLVAPTTDWTGICSAVLKVFKESGVGEF
jgi:hypothetical protein